MMKSLQFADDEKAIRQLVTSWIEASTKGDLKTLLNLMTDDVIFLTPGQEPFGKEKFKELSQAMKQIKIEGTSEIKEIKIMSDWAYTRNYLKIKTIDPSGLVVNRSGYTLTIFHKGPDSQWRIARDANLLSAEK